MRFLVLVLCALAGCVATETGNPTMRPELNLGAVDGQVVPNDPMLPAPPTIAVRGMPGSVDPPEGRVLGWGLERVGPPAASNVDADGGFLLHVEAAEHELIRLQIEAPDGTRSLPIDVRVSSTEGLSAAPAMNACLSVEPATSLLLLANRAGAEATVVLTNGCAEPVARGEAALRNGEAGLTVLDEGPLDVPPAGTSVVRVRLAASSPALEDILLIPIVGPEPELRAISIVTEQ